MVWRGRRTGMRRALVRCWRRLVRLALRTALVKSALVILIRVPVVVVRRRSERMKSLVVLAVAAIDVVMVIHRVAGIALRRRREGAKSLVVTPAGIGGYGMTCCRRGHSRFFRRHGGCVISSTSCTRSDHGMAAEISWFRSCGDGGTSLVHRGKILPVLRGQLCMLRLGGQRRGVRLVGIGLFLRRGMRDYTPPVPPL